MPTKPDDTTTTTQSTGAPVTTDEETPPEEPAPTLEERVADLERRLHGGDGRTE